VNVTWDRALIINNPCSLHAAWQQLGAIHVPSKLSHTYEHRLDVLQFTSKISSVTFERNVDKAYG